MTLETHVLYVFYSTDHPYSGLSKITGTREHCYTLANDYWAGLDTLERAVVEVEHADWSAEDRSEAKLEILGAVMLPIDADHIVL